MKKNNDVLLGAHVSIAKGHHLAFERAESIHATAMQIFTKSSRAYFDTPLSEEEINLFHARAKTSSVAAVVVHAGYLINSAASHSDTEKKSIASLKFELERCQQLGIPHLVLHPGSHNGAGLEKGIAQIAKNLDMVFDAVDGNSMILLETAAGQGSSVGHTFEQLAEIRALCTHKRRVGICLDTCHVFAAGYDLATEDDYHALIEKFDATIGLAHLRVIHVNDSKTPCNSHVDRHEALGKGHIPLTIFACLMNDTRLTHVPKILETPSDDEMKLYAYEIALLREMVRG